MSEKITFLGLIAVSIILSILIYKYLLPDCPACGENVFPQDVYCRHCGQQLRITNIEK